MGARPIILDCDPGIDDAVTLMLAAASPEVELLAVTTVAGNVPLEQTSANALAVLEAVDFGHVPVHAGAPRPILKPYVPAKVHGQSGIDGAGLAPPVGALAPGRATQVLIDTVLARPGEVTILAVGPLTNLALALVQAPELAHQVRQILVMGGSGRRGAPSEREFNFSTDPHAARILLETTARPVLFGLDVTHQATITTARVAAIGALGNRAGRAAAGMLSHYAQGERHLHDPCTLAYLLEPEIFSGSDAAVSVASGEGADAGLCTIEWDPPAGSANAHVMEELDAERLFALVTERLARLP